MATRLGECALTLLSLTVVFYAGFCDANVLMNRNDTQYLLVNSTLLNWTDAVAYCRDQGMQLATPRDKEENEWIRQAWRDLKPWGWNFWIGVTDMHNESEFTDTYGIPVTFTNWIHPPHVESGDCVYMHTSWTDGNWHEASCRNRWNFICKNEFGKECTYNPCHPNAACYNQTGNYLCRCKTGYSGNGTNCEDINECLHGPCHTEATCFNTNGSFTCQCKRGYIGNGFSCRDADECLQMPCITGASCVNTVGSYMCECQKGFNPQDQSCEDIDECLDSPCHTMATCSNTPGTYLCRCNDGFTGDGRSCNAAPETDSSLDPCLPQHVTRISHPVSDVPERSANVTTSRNTEKRLLCDISMTEGWYMFLAPTTPDESTLSTMTMPTSCVKEYHCETKHPIWMRGDIPLPGEGIVNRQACLTVGDNCCAYTIALKLKACSDQVVAYYLTPPQTCASAYCFGDHSLCPPGQVSPTGFTPGCRLSSIIELQHDPVISLEPKTNSFNFRCSVRLPTNNELVTVEILWLAGVNQIDSKRLKTQLAQIDFDEEDRKFWSHFGKEISCKARYFTGELYSQWRQSNNKLLGIEILDYSDQPIEVQEDNEIDIRLKLHAPYFGDEPLDILAFVPGDNQDGAHCSTGEAIPQVAMATSCGTKIHKSNWSDIHTIKVRASVDGKIERGDHVLRSVRLRTPSQVTGHSAWANYHLPEIKVLIKDKDKPVAVCRSTNDPHMKSFDGRYYELQKEGEFVLYRHLTEPLEVHAQYKSCGRNNRAPYCNCAVGILAAGDVITFDKCGRSVIDISSWGTSNRLRVAVRGSCNQLRGARILQENGGRRYVVQLHTGTSVIIEDSWSSFINLYVEASLRDLEQTEGLCGRYDLNCSNDLIPKGSQTLPADYGQQCYGYPYHPLEFTESWRLEEKNSILHWHSGSFKNDERLSNFDGHLYCTCDAQGVVDVSECRTGGDVPRCQPKRNQRDVSDSRFEPCRRRRDTSWHDHVDFLDYDESDYTLVAQPRADDIVSSNESPSRHRRAAPFTNETAQQYCTNYISGTEAGRKCSALNIDTDGPIDACVLDLMATNDPNWASAALDTVKQQCMSELDKNTTRWVPQSPDSNVTVPPPDIEGVLCFNECNGNGACINGSCVCNESFAGPDCSINMTAAPLLFYTPMCDLKTRQCKSNPVIGNNFLENDKLTCHFYQQKIGPQGLMPTYDAVHNKTAVFENYAEVTCPLPEINKQVASRDAIDPVAYKVHVSNDGVRQSRYGVLIVFNSVCFTCTINTTSCTENENSCGIEGRCYASNERDPLNKCNICNPTQSRTSWTFSPPSDSSRLCVIKDKCYASNEPHPIDECKVCDPSKHSDDWSIPSQSSSACIIDGLCYKRGQQNLDNVCMLCNPQQSTTSWSMSSSSSCLVSTTQNIPPTHVAKVNMVAVIAGTCGALAAVVVVVTAISVYAARVRNRKIAARSSQETTRHKLPRQEEHVF